MVNSTPRPHFSPGKDLVPILQETGWASGPVWTGGKSRPHRDSIPDRSGRSQSLYQLSYPVVLFIYLLLVSLGTISSASILAILLKSELERMWKEALEACVHSQYCPYIFTPPPVTDILRGPLGPSKRLDTLTHGRSIISQKKGISCCTIFWSVAW